MGKRSLLLLLILLSMLSLAMSSDHIVQLTAAQVTSAGDIELAIERATNAGAHPGIVMLDASEGEFRYDLALSDHTINIGYPHVTLRSHNGAVIANCADGIFLDEAAASHIHIEGITFYCEANGILAGGTVHNEVTLHNNVIVASAMGIEIFGGRRWRITRNQVTAGFDAVNISQSHGAFVAHNKLSGGEIGVMLDRAHESSLICNQIDSSWQGVLLLHATDENKIVGNKFVGVQHSGIAFEEGSRGNQVHGNHVVCLPDHDCQVVDASPTTYESNKITGNRAW